MVEKIACSACGKISYTSSPRFMNKCGYCGKNLSGVSSGKVQKKMPPEKKKT